MALDAAPTMHFASGGHSKLEAACEATSLLAAAALGVGDRFGLLVHEGGRAVELAPRRGELQLHRALDLLARDRAQHDAAPLRLVDDRERRVHLAGQRVETREVVEDQGIIAGGDTIQVGLRGYYPDADSFEWMRENGMRYHPMAEVEKRGWDAVMADVVKEAKDGPEYLYVSFDIDTIDLLVGLSEGSRPGLASIECDHHAAVMGDDHPVSVVGI